MHLSLYEQGEVFRLAFVFGLALGVYYDLFRFIRALGFTARHEVFLQDIVFMCTCGILCFYFAEAFLHGHLRIYAVMAHITGFAAYRLTVGSVTGHIYKSLGKILYIIMSQFEHITLTFGHILNKIASMELAYCNKIWLKLRKYSE